MILNIAYTHTPGLPLGDSHFVTNAVKPESDFRK